MRQKAFDFFKPLEDAAEINELAAAELLNILGLKSADFSKITKRISKLEEKQEKLYHSFTEHIRQAFITPLDREDLLAIFLEQEKLMRVIGKTAGLIDTMQIRDIRPEAEKLGDFILKGSKALTAAVREVRTFKKSKLFHEKILRLGEIRKEGLAHSKRAVRQLFIEEKNTLSIVKWKAIYYSMEEILNSMEDSIKTIEKLVIKNN